MTIRPFSRCRTALPTDVGLRDLPDLDGRLDARGDVRLLEGVLEGKAVDHGRQHPHVVALRAIHPLARPLEPAEDVAAPDDYAALDPERVYVGELRGEAPEDVRRDAEPPRRSAERLSAQLEDDPFVLEGPDGAVGGRWSGHRRALQGAACPPMYLGVPGGAMCSKARCVATIRNAALLLCSFAVAVPWLTSGAVVGACNGKAGPGAGDAGDHHTSDSLTPEQQAKVLAKIGDTTLTLGDYVAALEHMDQFDRLRYQSPERRKELLTEMINVKLLAQEARDKGYDKDPRVQEELRAVLRERDAEGRPQGPRRRRSSTSPPDDVRAYYEAHRSDFRDPERRRLLGRRSSRAQAAADAALEQTQGKSPALRRRSAGRARPDEVDRPVGAKSERPRPTSPATSAW